jgi:RNA polymerase sigma-70 factor (ECF subfamily)
MVSHSTTWRDDMVISAAEKAGGEIAAMERFERSDRQLVEMVLAGDETAFEDIFQRHKRLAASVAARYFKRPEQVEEIVQTAFTKMYFELKNFRGLHDLSLAGWLSKITANACVDMLRSQKRRPEDLECDLPDPEILGLETSGFSGEQPHIERDLAAKLLARLAAEDRVLLQMLYVDEFSVAETAEALGWSVSKTKVRAWRTRNALRKIVKKLL